MCPNRSWQQMDRMNITSRVAQIATIATITVIVSTSSGCAAASKATDWLTGKRPAETEDHLFLGAPSADEYLKELNDLAGGDPAKQADVFADASSAARLTPGPSTNLRIALVLATPGHAESDPARAQGLLREILAETQLLTSAEIALATIHLNNVERVIVTTSEATQLRDSTSLAARTEEQALSRRLATVEAENRRLRDELADAEQKLEAITSIERSIRDQE